MATRRNIFLICGLVIALIGVAALAVMRSSLGAQDPPDPKAEIRHTQREARYNAQAYLYYKNKNTIGWSKRRDGDFNSTHISYAELGDINDPAVLSRLQEAERIERQQHICAADVIVKGEIMKSRGVITDDDNLIYTVYTFEIADVMRAKPGIETKSDQTIQFTAPGGTAIVTGEKGTKSVTFNWPFIQQLKIDTQYILYLKRDEEADDYYVQNQYGVFVVERDTITRMDALMEPFYQERHRYLDTPANMNAMSTAFVFADCK